MLPLSLVNKKKCPKNVGLFHIFCSIFHIDELECTNIAAKTSDLEEVDKETIHFLVFLFMQYLSHPDQAGKSNAHDDENSSGKNKDDQHHMSGALLGHSFGKASEKAFQNLYTLIGKKFCLRYV